MSPPLRSNDDNLRDLADGSPLLMTPDTRRPTGIRLVRWLGAGGMSAVLLAERDPAGPAELLSELTPARFALKVLKPATEHRLVQLNLRGVDIARREIEALSAVRALRPPTEFIVSFYGSGAVAIQSFDDPPQVVPWIALEYVEAGGEGSTLSDRVRRAQAEGIDPVRALRLARGMIEGVSVLHRLGVLHRDIKPDNVFVAGPVDDETPKLGDCGIARVDGVPSGAIAGTIAAGTLEYGGPEQMLSMLWPTERNPLVNTWTDVHALAATIWFVIAGEGWYRSRNEWDSGERRSLRTARKLHRGWLEEAELLDAVDEVLRRGASPRLPPAALEVDGADRYRRVARQRWVPLSRADRPARHAAVDELAQELLPLLEAAAARWTERAIRENRPATRFRSTRLLHEAPASQGPPRVAVREIPAPRLPEMAGLAPAAPGGVVFLPGAWGFARFGERVFCFAHAEPRFMEVPVPREHRAALGASRWLVRGPTGGVAFIGQEHALLLPRTTLVPGALPAREGEIGPIQAAVGDGRTFGVVTAETDDSNGGPELWLSRDGASFGAPIILPLGGDVHALAPGPLGMLVVGGRRGARGRALLLGYDRQAQVITAGVNERPPLHAAVAGVEGEFWTAGAGFVLRVDRGGASEESVEWALEAPAGAPVAMGLDLAGIPWLVTDRAVLRRHGANAPVWRAYYTRPDGAPPLVAIGFTTAGVRVFDALGGGALLQPEDTSATAPLSA